MPESDATEDSRTDPLFWFIQARDLYSAAEALFDRLDSERSVFLTRVELEARRATLSVDLNPEERKAWRFLALEPVALMLFGLSLEVLVKGVAIARSPNLARSSGLDRKLTSGNHGLAAIFDLAKIEISADQRSLLSRLSEYIRWRGRYPMPKLPARDSQRDAERERASFLQQEFDEVAGLWAQVQEAIATDPSIPKIVPI